MYFFSERVFNIIFIVFNLLFGQVVYCQINSWSHTHYTTKDGLTSNEIANVIQDRNGFIWIATKSGLNRFDGDEFISVLHDENDPTTIPIDIINNIVLAPNGLILVGTFKGLFVMDPLTNHGYTIHSSITKGLESLDDNFKCITVRADIKKIVAMTSTAFIYFDYDLKKTSTIAYKFPKNAYNLSKSMTNYYPIFMKTGNAIFWDEFTNSYSYVDYKLKGIYPLHKLGSNPYYLLSNGNIDVSKMDYNGNIWFHKFAVDSLFCCKPGQKIVAYPLKGKTKNVNWVSQILFPDENQMIWGYSELGKTILYKLSIKYLLEHPGCDIIAERPSGFSAGLHSIFTDKDNNWWIGSMNGLYFIRSNSTAVERIDLPTPFKSESKGQHVSDIQLINNADLLITTYLEHCYLYNIVNNQIQSYLDTADYKHAGYYQMTEIVPLDKNRKLILGYQDFTFQDNKLTKGLNPNNEFEGYFKKYATNCFFIDSQGNPWVSFENFGLVKWNSKNHTLKTYLPKNGFNSDYFTSITEDSEGNMWFANYAKNYLWKRNIKTNEFEIEKIPELWHSKFKWINEIVAGENHILYLSTRQGIIVYDYLKKSVKEINMIDGLPSNIIEGLYYYQNHLYVSTNNGLAVINSSDNTIQILNSKNGIRENITTHAMFIDKLSNILYLGGKSCVYKIDLNKYFSSVNLPFATISQLKVNNSNLPLNQTYYTFNPDQNNLSIILNSIDYNSVSNKQYFYLLTVNGNTSNWTKNIGKQLNLSNLSAGNYKLALKTRNSKNQWSENTAVIKFEILKPWYNRLWFYLICIIAIFCISYAIYNNKITQLKNLYNIRNRLSRDLHDDIGSTLSSINILSRTAHNTLKQSNELKTAESLEKINERSQRLLDSMSDIIWSVNPQNDTIEEVMSRMREFATTILEAKGIEYSFDFPKDHIECKLSMEVKNNMYLIFKEAVNNCSKYANASKVNLSLSFEEKIIHLNIEDNGAGFIEEELNHIRGLNNMRHRAKEINGQLIILSQLEHGTIVSLSVPRYS